MASVLERLKRASARLDGLMLAPDGGIDFAATNANGAWTEAQKNAVRAALGLGAPVSAPARRAASIAAAIETWLDRTAQGLGFNNIVTAVSYTTSSVELWQRQAAALAAWRDAVWQAALLLLVEPARLPENDAAMIAKLPQPDIPTS
ncbi:MAG TPA: hypothetical protein VGP48_06705 [Stellaceae bacterium]|jgi:hypothetical protein|nr:hypothetical protein [Stellaceae bacterium]